jgi:hypothetical protein
MARVPLIEEQDHPEFAEVIEKYRSGRRGKLLNIYRMLLNSPALAYTDTMTRDIVVPDEVFAEVERHFDARQIVELTVLIGSYNMNARVMQALRLDLEPVAS